MYRIGVIAFSGVVGSGYSMPILSIGNNIAFGDPVMTGKQYIGGMLLGGLVGGAVNGGIAVQNGGGFRNGYGATRNLYAPNSSSTEAIVDPNLEYTNEFARGYSDEKFGQVNGLHELYADYSVPSPKYHINAKTGRAFFNKREVLGATTYRGAQGSDVYLFKGAFESIDRLYLTMGHEYVHVGFDYLRIGASIKTEEASAYRWSMLEAEAIHSKYYGYFKGRFNDFKRFFNRKYNYITPR